MESCYIFKTRELEGVGVLMKLGGHMVWDCGNIFVLDGRWEKILNFFRFVVGMVMLFAFGMIFGMVQGLLNMFFFLFTRFLVIKRLWWLTCWCVLMVLSIGMSVFLERFMIGNWECLPTFSTLCMLCHLVM